MCLSKCHFLYLSLLLTLILNIFLTTVYEKKTTEVFTTYSNFFTPIAILSVSMFLFDYESSRQDCGKTYNIAVTIILKL